MISDWLHSHEFGDALYLGVLDVASNCDTEDGANDSDNPEDISLDDTFDTFLEEVVVRRPGSRITTNHIRTAWAARHGADPTAEHYRQVSIKLASRACSEHTFRLRPASEDARAERSSTTGTATPSVRAATEHKMSGTHRRFPPSPSLRLSHEPRCSSTPHLDSWTFISPTVFRPCRCVP